MSAGSLVPEGTVGPGMGAEAWAGQSLFLPRASWVMRGHEEDTASGRP